MNQSDQEQVIREALDTEKIQLVCKKHNYLGGKMPPKTSGCKDCWYAFYVWDLATTPPSQRQQRLDELEEVIHHAIEYEQKGQFTDFKLFEPGDPRLKIEYEKDAE